MRKARHAPKQARYGDNAGHMPRHAFVPKHAFTPKHLAKSLYGDWLWRSPSAWATVLLLAALIALALSPSASAQRRHLGGEAWIVGLKAALNHAVVHKTRTRVVVYEDVNGNGTRDPGERALPGWSITASPTTGPATEAVKRRTGASGVASFDLDPGEWVFSEQERAGWVCSDPGAEGLPKTITRTLVWGAEPGDSVFGNYQLIAKHVGVYEDTNRNGAKDAGEPPLPGWSITASPTAGAATEKVDLYTGASGVATFSLDPGEWVFSEEERAGWVCSDPVMDGLPKTITQTLSSRVAAGDSLFGNYEHGANPKITACVVVYEDTNGDGTRDDGEPPVPGWSITASRAVGAAAGKIDLDTGASGVATFSLDPGEWVFSAEERAGWVCSDPGTEGLPKTITRTLAWGAEPGDTAFGNYRIAVRSGVDFWDKDGDGTRDDGDGILAGRSIYLDGIDGAGNAVHLTDTTDSRGAFSFSVAPGTYVTSGVTERDWAQTHPALASIDTTLCSGRGQTIGYVTTLQSGDEDDGADFGNARCRIALDAQIAWSLESTTQPTTDWRDSLDAVFAGTHIYYRYVITNTGEVPLRVEECVDDAGTPDVAADDVTVDVALTLDPSDVATVPLDGSPYVGPITAQVAADGGTLVNTARASALYTDAAGVPRDVRGTDTAWYQAIPDGSPPTVSITSPADGTAVSGTVNIAATASDSGSGVERVEFLVDGVLIGSDTSPPYTCSWTVPSIAGAATGPAARFPLECNALGYRDFMPAPGTVRAMTQRVGFAVPALRGWRSANQAAAAVEGIQLTGIPVANVGGVILGGGSHTIQATGYDAVGNSSTASVRVTAGPTTASPVTSFSDLPASRVPLRWANPWIPDLVATGGLLSLGGFPTTWNTARQQRSTREPDVPHVDDPSAFCDGLAAVRDDSPKTENARGGAARTRDKRNPEGGRC